MSSLRTRVQWLMRWLVEDPGVIWLLTIAYVLFGLFFVQTDYTLNDEGMLTHYWASWMHRDFLPVFFFQRVRPVVCALYAAVSAGGRRATLAAHVVVAATAIPLVAATARSLGQRLPNLPAMVVALSPLYFYGGASGFSNIDGIVGMALVLYLLCTRRLAFAAGVVAGLLPWVRTELVVFCGVMALAALLVERERPMLIGMALFPLAYVSAGAFYHRDLLWMAHFPPTAPLDPANPIYHNQLIGLRYFLEPVVAVTPVAAVAVALPFERLQRVERALLAFAVLNAVAMNILPIFRIGNFGAAPRYLLLLLPALALLVGRALEPWWEGERPHLALLLVTALAALWVATRQEDQRISEMLIVVYGLVLVSACLRAGALAVVLTALLVLAGPLLPLRTDVGRPKYLDPMAAWLAAHPGEGGASIYTNAQLLAPFLDRRLPGVDVYYLAGIDLTREMTLITDLENGQRDRLRLLWTDLYGKTLFAPFGPDDLPAGALLALRQDVRLPLLLPPATWSPRLEVLVETPDYRIARLRPAVVDDTR